MLRSGGIPPSLRNRGKDTSTTRPHAKEGGRRCRARPRYSTAYRLRPPPTSPLRKTDPLAPVIVSPSLTCLSLRSVFAYARFGTPSSGFRDNRPSPPASLGRNTALVRQRSPTPPPPRPHRQGRNRASLGRNTALVRRRSRPTGRSLARLSSHSPRALRNSGAMLRQGALPPRPPQGGVAPLTRTFLPALGAGQEGQHSPEYRLVRERFRSLAKTPRLPVCPLPGKGRVRPPRLTTPASENRAQETARPHPCRSTRSAWQRRPSPVRPG